MTDHELEQLTRLKKQKDAAYWERNQLVAALSKLFPAHLAKHSEHDKDWEADWRTIVVIYLPPELNMQFQHVFKDDSLGAPVKEYQLSWHIHDTDVPMFDHLNYQAYEWDGHSTEEKYRTLRNLIDIHCNYWWDKLHKHE